MSALMDDTAGITIIKQADDEHGNPRFQWSATLGDGTRRGFASSEEDAQDRAVRAKRFLLAVESHDPDVIESRAQQAASLDRVELISAWGGTITVNAADVEQALANGCRLLGDDEPEEHAASVSRPERARRRSRSAADDESEVD